MLNTNQRIIVGLLLAAVLGCDANPDGPTAPTKPNPGAGDVPAKTTPGVIPRPAGGSPKAAAAAPTEAP